MMASPRRYPYDPFPVVIALTTLLVLASLLPPTKPSDEGAAVASRTHTFALIPKSRSGPFFDLVNDGCQDRAAELTTAGPDILECRYYTSKRPRNDAGVLEINSSSTIDARGPQIAILDQIVAEGNVSGIAIAVDDPTSSATNEAIARAVDSGIPVVTYDSDASSSRRSAYIGTDNYAMGRELGKLFNQLDPVGGVYGIVGTSTPNIRDRIQGVRDELEGSEWKEAGNGASPTDCRDDPMLALRQMIELGSVPGIAGIVPVGGWPMMANNPNLWKDFVRGNRHLTLVLGDALPSQVEFMNKGYGNGLVGQFPYQMGALSIDVLLAINRGEYIENQGTIFGTSLLEILRHPLEKPALTVNMNYIGGLAFLGYFFFGVIAALTLAFASWTYKNRAVRVVKASQPEFLIMICFGVLTFGSSIIPMTIDDEHHSQSATDAACMSIPWLMSIGFTTIFSAFFSKLWRVNLIFQNPNKFKRVKVTPRNVILPYVSLMASDIIVLSCWTAIAPLQYVRTNYPGLDPWNRAVSSHGICTRGTDKSYAPFVATLVSINCTVIIIANIQAYRARSVHTEYSESRYIALVMAGMLQAVIVGAPILALVYDDPRAFFLVLSSLVFATSVAVLLFTFVPKIIYTKEWMRQRDEKREDGERTRKTVIRREGAGACPIVEGGGISDNGATAAAVAELTGEDQSKDDDKCPMRNSGRKSSEFDGKSVGFDGLKVAIINNAVISEQMGSLELK